MPAVLPLLRALCRKIERSQRKQLKRINRARERAQQPLFPTWQDYQLWTQIRLYKEKQR
ncbi:MAG: hypothetical protein Q4G02_00375 [bacterium]|nr:hypothetical protein [bacterium]